MDNLEREKSYSKLEWFLYIILLPTIFTLLLLGIILTFMKVDVLQTVLELGNKIPFVERILPDPKPDPNQELADGEKPKSVIEQLKEQLIQYEQNLTLKDETIKKQEQELNTKEQELQKLQEEIEVLKTDIEEKLASEEERKAKIAEMAKLYSSMSVSKAASIIENLGSHEAVMILEKMNEKSRSDVLAKMDAKKAADLSILLKETTYSADLEIKALQERVNELVLQLDEASKIINEAKKLKESEVEKLTAELSDLVQSFEVMESNAAADILIKMWNNGSRSQVLSILTVVNPNIKSNILEEMIKVDAELTATIISNLLK